MKIITWLLSSLLISSMAHASVEEFIRVVEEHQEVIKGAIHPDFMVYEKPREDFHRFFGDLTLEEQYRGILKLQEFPTVTDTYFISMTLRNACLTVARTDAYMTDPEIRHKLIVLCGNTKFVNKELEASIRARFDWSMQHATKRDLYWMNKLKSGLDASRTLWPSTIVELKDKLDRIALY